MCNFAAVVACAHSAILSDKNAPFVGKNQTKYIYIIGPQFHAKALKFKGEELPRPELAEHITDRHGFSRL